MNIQEDDDFICRPSLRVCFGWICADWLTSESDSVNEIFDISLKLWLIYVLELVSEFVSYALDEAELVEFSCVILLYFTLMSSNHRGVLLTALFRQHEFPLISVSFCFTCLGAVYSEQDVYFYCAAVPSKGLLWGPTELWRISHLKLNKRGRRYRSNSRMLVDLMIASSSDTCYQHSRSSVLALVLDAIHKWPLYKIRI